MNIVPPVSPQLHQLVHHQHHQWVDRSSHKKLRTTFSGSQVAQVDPSYQFHHHHHMIIINIIQWRIRWIPITFSANFFLLPASPSDAFFFIIAFTILITLINDHPENQLEGVFEQQKYLSSGERAALAR